MTPLPPFTKAPCLKRVSIACLCATFSPLLQADQIRLNNGTIINGAVTNLDQNKQATFTTPHSLAPITLRASSFQSIIFNEGKKPTQLSGPSTSLKSPNNSNSQTIRLINGDLLNASLSEISDDSVTFSMEGLPKITILRKHLDYLQFGHDIKKLVYDGPKKLDTWKSVSGFSLHNGELISGQRGRAALLDILPKNFALDFNLAWEDGQFPKLNYHFCSNKSSPYSSGSWYYLSINAQGISIHKRDSSASKRYTSLSNLQFKPQNTPNHKLHISLRCDRDKGTIFLYLDNKLASSIYGLKEIPKGNNIILESNGDNSSVNRFTNFDISQWNSTEHTPQPDHLENNKQDSFLNEKGDLYTGTILGLRLSDKKEPSFQFQNIHAAKPLSIDSSQLTYLFFAKKEEVKGSAVHEKQPYLLHLQDGGTLQIKDPRLNGRTLHATHPILGAITLDQGQLNRLIAK